MPKLIAAFLMSLLLATPVLAGELRVMGHRIPPFSMHEENHIVSGFSAELFKAVHNGVTQEKSVSIIPVTFNRLYSDLQNAKRTIGITVGRNAKREKLFQWVGPYLSVHLGVVGKKSRNFKIAKVDDLKGHRIATIKNTAPEQALLKMGLPEGAFVRDLYPERNIKKLQSDRVDFMAYPIEATSYLMIRNSIPANEYEEVFPLRTIKLYFAFSQDFTPEEIAAYQQQLDKALKSEKYHHLRKKYSLDEIQKYISN